MASKKDFMASTKTLIYEHSSTIKNQGALIQSHSSSLRALENQAVKIAMAIYSRPQGSLPSDTEVTKTHGNEQCSTLTLRSGTQINLDDKFGGKKQEISRQGTTQEEPKGQADEIRTPPPLFKKFVDVLDKLYINVPLLETIDQMLSYAKLLKEFVTKKRKVERLKIVATTKEYCSTLYKLLPKEKHPDTFVIPCSIGDKYVGRALFNLGSNINLMPKYISLKLGMGNDQPTNTVRQKKMHILFSRTFLATGCILIYCKKGEFTMRVADQSIIINFFKTLKYVDDSKECHYIEVIDSVEEDGIENFGKGRKRSLKSLWRSLSNPRTPELMSFDENTQDKGLERGAKYVVTARMAAVITTTLETSE
ncbi:uncharacterized protein LOC120187997 [Hibiscus syriacus]|uniref:uncharacterized protein LOC120187997 n=1 Tax=Hibiscus syriacus TaxID=106335 RepID=UPI001921E84A|nr:uncharacterized protein LOC120187997 [Hibiscus syriacus]